MTVKTKKQQTTKKQTAQTKNGQSGPGNNIISRLNTLLADEQLLYVKTREYHWNVEGLHFVALHQLFEEQYDTLSLRADVVAEQVRKLEGKAIGTLQAFLDNTRLTEKPGQSLDEQAMIKNLLADHEALMETVAEDIEYSSENADEGTTDMLIQTLREHQSMAWKLRSMVQ
jgi:starvation-inducible DNA-binding protein